MKHDKMNIFQITLVFICFVNAKGNFPAVIITGYHSLTEPMLLSISDTEVEVGFDESGNYLHAACPRSDYEPNKENEISEVLGVYDIVPYRRRMCLNEIPLCKSQPQVTFKELPKVGEYNWYLIGYKVFYKESGDRPYTTRDVTDFKEIFTLNFNTATKTVIWVKYNLATKSRFISTASNKKLTFLYEKNEAVLKIDLDSLYHNFVDQILPQMVDEKSANQLAHALGIQKVQLATPDDFVLDTWKMATYWNINTVPIWRVLLLRWNAIEIYLRKVFKRNIDIRIETGVSGTLELAERYYESDTVHKLHIPKYVWKLIPETYLIDEAMLIVMHNDPFTQNQKPLCADICAINGWLISNNDYRTGLIYCCKITENIAQILGYSINMKDNKIYSFTKNADGTENLKNISSILSDLREKLYDW